MTGHLILSIATGAALAYSSDNMFTDIKKSWIEKLPSPARPYAYLMRLDRPIGSWLLFWPGIWAILLAAQFPEMSLTALQTIILFAIGAPIMRAAGCIVNDLWDRKLDQKVERTATRPLASGKISPRAAIINLGVLLTLGFAILLQLPLTSVLLGIAVLPFIAIYPLMKRLTYWPQAFLGITFNFGVLIGWAAMDITLPPEALILYLGGVFWTLAYDTIYGFQDIEDDLKIGVKSTSILFKDSPLFPVSLFYFASLTLVVIVAATQAQSYWAVIFFIPAFIHISRLIYAWNPQSQSNSLDSFKANKWTGFWLALGCLCTTLVS